jgi:hypothetical protein
MSSLALGPHQPLVQWVVDALSLVVRVWDMRSTIHLHLLLKLRKSESVLPLLLYATMADE